MGGTKPCPHLMRLRHGQRRSAGTQAQGRSECGIKVAVFGA
jgi:hypothetical protein